MAVIRSRWTFGVVVRSRWPYVDSSWCCCSIVACFSPGAIAKPDSDGGGWCCDVLGGGYSAIVVREVDVVVHGGLGSVYRAVDPPLCVGCRWWRYAALRLS